MLFIPWLFRMLEGRDVLESQLRTEARALEIRLADALKRGGETNGVIGRDAGLRLQRLPSSVYWAGLGAWGIRLFPGSTDSLFVSLRGLKRWQRRRLTRTPRPVRRRERSGPRVCRRRPRSCSAKRAFA
jgi:hypothetical protein